MDSEFHQWDVNYDQAKQLPIGTTLECEAFSAGGHQWKIKLYPRGSAISDNGAYMSIFLELMEWSPARSVNVFFEVFLMEKNGQPSRAARSGLVLQACNQGWPRLVSHSDVEENFLTEGCVTVLFAVTVMSDNSIPVPPSELGKHTAMLLDTLDGSDTAFSINGETFHAHRALLAARSPVFREQLYGSMSESTELPITLNGMPPETFRDLLAFIYTDTFTENHESLPASRFHSLLAEADRYALDRLKHMCAQKLLNDVTLDTVVTTLACAEIYSCQELKDKCLDFIAAEADDKFLFSEDYLQLGLNFPCILPDLCQRRFNPGHQHLPHHLHLSDCKYPSYYSRHLLFFLLGLHAVGTKSLCCHHSFCFFLFQWHWRVERGPRKFCSRGQLARVRGGSGDYVAFKVSITVINKNL